jgi:hypothetical protein
MGQYKSDTLHDSGSHSHSDTLSLIPCITVVDMITDTIDDMTLTPLSLSVPASCHCTNHAVQCDTITKVADSEAESPSLRSRHNESRIQPSGEIPECQARV